MSSRSVGGPRGGMSYRSGPTSPRSSARRSWPRCTIDIGSSRYRLLSVSCSSVIGDSSASCPAVPSRPSSAPSPPCSARGAPAWAWWWSCRLDVRPDADRDRSGGSRCRPRLRGHRIPGPGHRGGRRQGYRRDPEGDRRRPEGHRIRPVRREHPLSADRGRARCGERRGEVREPPGPRGDRGHAFDHHRSDRPLRRARQDCAHVRGRSDRRFHSGRPTGGCDSRQRRGRPGQGCFRHGYRCGERGGLDPLRDLRRGGWRPAGSGERRRRHSEFPGGHCPGRGRTL